MSRTRLYACTVLTYFAVAGMVSAGEETAQNADQKIRSTYVLGPDDQFTVRGMHADEMLDKPFRVEADGSVRLPLIGTMTAGGLTIEQFELQLTNRLKQYYFEPQISVSVTEYRSQPVSILGAVGNPGVHQLQGRKSLAEILSMVGGVRADAGSTLKITRDIRWGTIPLKGAHLDESGQFIVAEVNVKDLLEAKHPVENIQIQPNDVISVPVSPVVYVIGEVKKSGGFVLGSRPNLSVLEALSMAEGFQPKAAPKKAKILRPMSPSDTHRTEIALDISKILAGKANDVQLEPNDILYIPNSAAKNAAMRTVEAAVQIGTGLVIWHL